MTTTPPAPDSNGQPQQQIVYVEKKRGGLLRTLLIVGGVCLFLMVGCVVVISMTANEVIETIESEDANAIAAAKVTSCQEASFGLGEATVEFTNPFDEEKGWVSFEISYFDPSGVVIGSGNVIFENIGPGVTARGSATSLDLADDSEVARCEIADVTVL